MSVRYMLDTNVVSEIIRDNHRVGRRLRIHGLAAISLSAIAAAELRFGYRKRGSSRLANLVETTISYLAVMPFDDAASMEYASVRAELERKGTPIGPYDMLIAAHARSLDLTLVTNNIGEFSRVDGLKLEDWVREGEQDDG